MIFISSYSFSDDIILVGIYVFEFNNGMHFTYADDGEILCLSNSLAKVEYHYTTDRLGSGYSITFTNGCTFTRNTIHDDYRRGLLTNISSAMNGSQLEGFSYGYDALDRPVTRNSATPREINPQYDKDGNLLSDGDYSFTYDSHNRLKTVSSNGVLLVTNYYDAKSRRVKKVTPNSTTVFFYDDWNLIEERITYANGTTSTIRWGFARACLECLKHAAAHAHRMPLAIPFVLRDTSPLRP